MIQHISRITRHSAVYTITSFAIAGGNMLLLPVFTRFLGPTDYGIVATASLISTILVPVLLVNQHGALSRFYFDHRDDPEALRSYIGTVLFFVLLWTGSISVLLLAFGASLGKAAGIPFIPFVPLAVLSSAVGGVTAMSLSLWRAKEESLKYLAMRLGVYFAGTLLAILFIVAFDGGAAGRLLGPLVGIFGGAVVSLFSFRRELSKLGLRFDYLKPSLAYGIPLVPHSVAREVVELSDRLFLNHFRTLAETGLYSVGYALANGFGLMLGAISAAWLPYVFGLIERQGEEAKNVISKFTSYYVLGIVALGIGLSLFAKEIIIFLTAPSFREAYIVVPIITASFIFKGLYYMAVTQIFYIKKTNWVLFASISTGGLNLLLDWLWIPNYGMIGAAWASFVSYLTLFAITWYVSWRLYPIKYEARAGLALIAALPIFVAGYWLETSQSLSSLLGFTARVGLIFGFGVFALAFFFTQAEMQAMISLGKRGLTKAGIHLVN